MVHQVLPVSTLSPRLHPHPPAPWVPARQPERRGPLRPGAGIPRLGLRGGSEGRLGGEQGRVVGVLQLPPVCVESAQRPAPPSCCPSLCLPLLFELSLPPGCRLPALGPEQHRLQEHRAPAARPTSWRGHLAGVQGLEHWSLGLWAECPGTGRQERGCTDRTFLWGKDAAAFRFVSGSLVFLALKL